MLGIQSVERVADAQRLTVVGSCLLRSWIGRRLERDVVTDESQFAPPLPAKGIQRATHRNSNQVGAHRRLTAERLERLMEPDERFLTDIVGVIAGTEHSADRARNCRLMAFHQATEGVVIATLGASDQCGIIIGFDHSQSSRPTGRAGGIHSSAGGGVVVRRAASITAITAITTITTHLNPTVAVATPRAAVTHAAWPTLSRARGVVPDLLVRGQDAGQRLLRVGVRREHRRPLRIVRGRPMCERRIHAALLARQRCADPDGLVGGEAKLGGHPRHALIDARWATAIRARAGTAPIGCGRRCRLLRLDWGRLEHGGAQRGAGQKEGATVRHTVILERR